MFDRPTPLEELFAQTLPGKDVPVFEPSQNRIKIVSKKNPDHIKILSKPGQPVKNQPKTCPGVVSASFLEANPFSKPYLNYNPGHIKNITNHIEITTPNSKRSKSCLQIILDYEPLKNDMINDKFKKSKRIPGS